MSRVENVRGLLLPGLYAANAGYPDIRLDAQIYNNGIFIQGFNTKTKNAIGFYITPKEIEDGLYKQSFRPCVVKVLDLLTNPEHAARVKEMQGKSTLITELNPANA